MSERHPENAPGEWYIDRHCMDCSAARTVAPGLIVERGGQSVFARQPQTLEELMMVWRARLLCPTGSVRTEHPHPQPKDVFPEDMTARVYRLGYNAEHSYGAHSFLIRRETGNVMVDSPRWAKPVVKQLEDWGGLTEILLSHQDDVGDADRYGKHFKARVAIHEADRDAAPYADRILEGTEPIALAPDLLAIPVPGHTRGSVAYLWDRHCLFTGDSLPGIFLSATSTPSGLIAGRGRRSAARSGAYSTIPSTGSSPATAGAAISPPPRCARASRRSSNAWQENSRHVRPRRSHCSIA